MAKCLLTKFKEDQEGLKQIIFLVLSLVHLRKDLINVTRLKKVLVVGFPMYIVDFIVRFRQSFVGVIEKVEYDGQFSECI